MSCDASPLAPVRMAIVGMGYWGPNLVRNLHDLPEADIAYVCDRLPEALGAIGRRYPAIRRSSDFDELLADPDVEAVAIATPVSTHYALVAAALQAGKHVFVEKPLARSIEEAASLVELALEQELILMPGHTFLYSPPVNLIRDLINDGGLGDIYFISSSRVNLGIHQSDVSVTWDLGPHDFSILRYWLGETPVRVAASSRGYIMPDVPDVAFITMEFPSGTLAHVELSWLAPSKLRRTAIVGSRKMIVYDDTSTEPVRIFDSGVAIPNPESFGEYRLSYRTGDIVSPAVEGSEPLSLEMRDFCAAVRGEGHPRSSANLALDVVRIAEAVDRSIANCGAPVAVDTATSAQAAAVR